MLLCYCYQFKLYLLPPNIRHNPWKHPCWVIIGMHEAGTVPNGTHSTEETLSSRVGTCFPLHLPSVSLTIGCFSYKDCHTHTHTHTTSTGPKVAFHEWKKLDQKQTSVPSEETSAPHNPILLGTAENHLHPSTPNIQKWATHACNYFFCIYLPYFMTGLGLMTEKSLQFQGWLTKIFSHSMRACCSAPSRMFSRPGISRHKSLWAGVCKSLHESATSSEARAGKQEMVRKSPMQYLGIGG